MDKIILIFHVLTALGIIGLILLQQGKGAEMGASFGSGASQTVFGSQGSGNFFSRMTAILAFVFFVTSFALAIAAKRDSSVGVVEGIPTVIEEQADLPALEESRSGKAGDPTVTDSDLPQLPTEENAASSETDIPEAAPAGEVTEDSATEEKTAE